jgi:hypothetical protein
MGVVVVDTEEVGKRIRLIRKHGLGLSGRDFAEQVLGVTDSSLTAKIEGGTVTHDRMKEIALGAQGLKALRDATYDDILGFLEGRTDELPLILHTGLTLEVIQDPNSRPNRLARRTARARRAAKGYIPLRPAYQVF